MQQRCAASGCLQREQHLVPEHAAVETPGVQPRCGERANVDAVGTQRFRQVALVDADPRGGSDRELRVDGDDQIAQRKITAVRRTITRR
jgi:hypothetical protein